MYFVFFSICCNIIVSVLLKLARRYEISIPQAVAWNYLMAALLTYLIYKPNLSNISASQAISPLFLSLAVLLPSLFIVIGRSIRYTGIVRTDLAQRLSLFIPLATAFIIFKEPLSGTRLAGITIGFAAIICSIPWGRGNKQKDQSKLSWLYPLIVFLGMGLIDILFKQVAMHTVIPYTSALFTVFSAAFVLSAIVLIISVNAGKIRFHWMNVLCGFILGLFNFGNILFYLKAHRQLPDSPSIIFSVMNIGVIAAGALVGVFLFKEKLSMLNKIGIVLAVSAILVIAFAA